jgi:PPOX class probable FMN-dependent enzyme
MEDEICDVEALESTVGSRPLAVMMKSTTELDSHCEAVLERSTAAVMAWRSTAGPMRSAIVGGGAGFVRRTSPSRLSFATPEGVADGEAVGLVILTPGWKETLRINGQVTDDGVEVDEALVHCGKAMIRSQLWSASASRVAGGPESRGDHVDDLQREFLRHASFAAIGSCDGSGAADVSPKGDPPGFVQVIDDTAVAIPDRPGNRRTDTFHNLLERPEVSLLALVPGDDRTLEISGRARIRTDVDLLASMAVNGRVPKMALVIDVEHTDLHLSPAVAAADLWDTRHHVATGDLPRAARIWADHVKQSDVNGVTARLIRTVANETAIHVGVERDYERNLY